MQLRFKKESCTSKRLLRSILREAEPYVGQPWNEGHHHQHLEVLKVLLERWNAGQEKGGMGIRSGWLDSVLADWNVSFVGDAMVMTPPCILDKEKTLISMDVPMTILSPVVSWKIAARDDAESAWDGMDSWKKEVESFAVASGKQKCVSDELQRATKHWNRDIAMHCSTACREADVDEDIMHRSQRLVDTYLLDHKSPHPQEFFQTIIVPEAYRFSVSDADSTDFDALQRELGVS